MLYAIVMMSYVHAQARTRDVPLICQICHTVTVLLRKLKFLARLMGIQSNSLGTITFQTLASFDVYDIGLVQQCLMLENQFMTNITMDCLREPNNAQHIVATSCSRLLKIDRDLAVQRAAEHPSLKHHHYLAETVEPSLRLWHKKYSSTADHPQSYVTSNLW